MELDSGENFGEFVQRTVSEMWEQLTLNGRSRVRDEKKHQVSSDLIEQASQEEFTKENIIRKVLEFLDIAILPERHFKWGGKLKRVDYRLKNTEGQMFLLEAKALNDDLYKKKDGAVLQIQEIFKLAEAKKEYEFGIATDGLRWIFIDPEGHVENEFELEKDFEKIKKRLVGEEKVVSSKTEEEITKRFYNWYNALLHGGVYKDRKGKRRSISKEDCLVKNIFGITYDEDREAIAQTLVDRLIFIKFLQTKGIIDSRILNHLTDLGERPLNLALDELFFRVMNRERDQRMNVDVWFKDIPYMNGSLFERTRAESRNSGYFIKVNILVEVISFLDSFSFVHKEGEAAGKIDPEILGYIFERAMTASDRKGTGAYYTPKTITRYIAENTIHPFILDKANEILRKEFGYKETELPETIDDFCGFKKKPVERVLSKVIKTITVLDPACGSGAFLQAAAHVLFEIHKRIRKIRGLPFGEVEAKKHILRNNLYGVDINKNAIEIAKLRLWLWLVDSYRPGKIEALPNIEYNIMAGNSLVGFVDISRFRNKAVAVYDYDMNEGDAELVNLLKKREVKLTKYKDEKGAEARKMKRELEKMEDHIGGMLDFEFHRFLKTEKNFELEPARFKELKSFHWGFEFYDVFHPDKPREMRGFDVVIGNPPYVRQESLKELKSYLKSRFQTYHGVADLYVYFIEQGVGLLREGGYFSYIVANKWMRANYGKALRRWLEERQLVELIDFGDLPVFQEATTYPSILVIKKAKPAQTLAVTQVKTLEFADLNEYVGHHQYQILQNSLDENGWSLVDEETEKVFNKIMTASISLEDYIEKKVFRGVVTGLNEAFVIDAATRNRLISIDPKNEEIIKPFLVGRDIKRYQPLKAEQYLIFTRRGIDIEKYPKIREYLSAFKEKLMPKPEDWKGEKWAGRKPGLYKWYEIQDTTAYFEEFEKIKILWPGISAEVSAFSIDESKHFGNDNVHLIITSSKYLLGILNSSLSRFILVNTCDKVQAGFYRLKIIYIKQLPIRTIDFSNPTDAARHHTMVGLVGRMLELHKELAEKPGDEGLKRAIEETDNEIDALVYELYELTDEEIKIVEEAVK